MCGLGTVNLNQGQGFKQPYKPIGFIEKSRGQRECQTLSSSAFVSSPLYGPSCFPVIISSVSVSLVLIMSQVSPVMSPYNSLFYPMLLVDYC